MKAFTLDEIQAWDKDFRANFFHAAIGIKPAVLIGTRDLQGISNAAIFSSVVHLGSNPPLFGFMVRPGDASNTHQNILQTAGFTMSLVPTAYIEQAHQTAARYEPEQNEFLEAQLQEFLFDGFPAFAHAPVVMRLKYLETIPIAHNNTKLVLGEVVATAVQETVLQPSGLIDHELASTAGVTGLDTYYAVQKIKRLAYAKPQLPPRTIDF
jgi:flavin reductase (DIM6/NTAB) family NADH-FMN oxidoreductase RutF